LKLVEYEQAKFELAEILRSLRSTVAKPTYDEEGRIQDLFVKLAEERFNLAVIGRFSRGKTSLINAMLGDASLPVGVVPLTSVITTVAYGTRPSATIKYKDCALDTEIALAQLPEYVTQQGNPANARRVRVAEVRLPAEILRKGFYFADTPGLASTIEENTRTTEAFIPEIDAFVLVTSHESPLSSEEMEIVRDALSSGRRVFVVVNKHDLLSPGQRGEVLADLERRLAGLPDAVRPDLFSISARDALRARLAEDERGLQESGLSSFEDALTRFLLSEKSARFLLRLCDRIGELASELLRQAGDPLVARARALARRIAEARALSQPIRAGEHTVAPSVRQLDSCEICQRMVQRAFDFLCQFQYRLSVDSEEQREHAGRGGLCLTHTWHYVSLASTHGICTGYPPLLQRLSAWFRGAARPGVSPRAIAREMAALVPGSEACPMCLICSQAEAESIAEVARKLSEDAHGAVSGLSALCLAHLRRVIASLDDLETVEDLLLREAMILERVSEDMRRYATKHDAARRFLASEEENRAARAAIALLAGMRNAQAGVHE
jgi:GTP-binding protein EngB required for normal cell division